MGSSYSCILLLSLQNLSVNQCQWSDIQLSPTTLTIRLHQFKADSFRRGHTLSILVTNTSTSPVKHYNDIKKWSQSTREWSIVCSWPILLHTHVSNTLRHLLNQAALDSLLYSSHCFRIGVATTSVSADRSPWLSKTLGQWNSDAYMITSIVPIMY